MNVWICAIFLSVHRVHFTFYYRPGSAHPMPVRINEFSIFPFFPRSFAWWWLITLRMHRGKIKTIESICDVDVTCARLPRQQYVYISFKLITAPEFTHTHGRRIKNRTRKKIESNRHCHHHKNIIHLIHSFITVQKHGRQWNRKDHMSHLHYGWIMQRPFT